MIVFFEMACRDDPILACHALPGPRLGPVLRQSPNYSRPFPILEYNYIYGICIIDLHVSILKFPTFSQCIRKLGFESHQTNTLGLGVCVRPRTKAFFTTYLRIFSLVKMIN